MQSAPKNLEKKRADEKLLVSEMIALYCRRQHKTPKGTLCPECRQLHDYALMRLISAHSWRPRPSVRLARCTATSRKCGKRSAW